MYVEKLLQRDKCWTPTMSNPSAEHSLRDWFLASNTTLIIAQIWFKINFIVIAILLVKLLLFVKREIDKKQGLYQRLPRLAICNLLGSDWFHSSACSQTMHKSCRRTCSWITLIKWTHLCILDSIISHAISFSLWLRCCPNSGSGQWRSRMNDCSASNFQNRSSEVAQPLLKSDLV